MYSENKELENFFEKEKDGNMFLWFYIHMSKAWGFHIPPRRKFELFKPLSQQKWP